MRFTSITSLCISFALHACIVCVVSGNFYVPEDPQQVAVVEGAIELSDLHGPDAEVLAELSKYMIGHLRRKIKCGHNTASRSWHSLKNLNSTYIDKLVNTPLRVGGWGIVSIARKRITALLTKAALTLPEGDIVETGCFFGTSAVVMLDVLGNFDMCNKKLWLFDSFEGLPMPVKEDNHEGIAGAFAATQESLISNLESTGFYNESRVVITKGWFKDTCKTSPVTHIAFLRLDGDLFASTWDAITALYDRVVPGGYIYVDDYGTFTGCRVAIDKFREEHKIYDAIHYVREPGAPGKQVLFEAIWWVKSNH